MAKPEKNAMPEPMKPTPTDREFEQLMADPPRGGFSAWRGSWASGMPYKRVLDAMKAREIEVWDLGGVPRLTPATVRQLREMSRGKPSTTASSTQSIAIA